MDTFQVVLAVLGTILIPVVISVAGYIINQFREEAKARAALEDEVDTLKTELGAFKLEVAKHYVHKNDLAMAVKDIKEAFRAGIADIKTDVDKMEKNLERQLDLFRKEISG